MTERERDQLAQAIYTSRYAGFFIGRSIKAWEDLRGVDKEPWLRTADAAWAVVNSAAWLGAAPVTRAA